MSSHEFPPPPNVDSVQPGSTGSRRAARGRRALSHPVAVAAITAGLCSILHVDPVAAAASRLVTGADVKNGSLSGKDIRDSSITTADLSPDALISGPAGPAGPTGPEGAAGEQGPEGPQGPRGLSSWDVIPSGMTVTGGTILNFTSDPDGATQLWGFDLPGSAPVPLNLASVNLAPTSAVDSSDADPSCTGSVAAPTAPPGKVCIYLSAPAHQFIYLTGSPLYADGADDQRRHFQLLGATRSRSQGYAEMGWAYTAP